MKTNTTETFGRTSILEDSTKAWKVILHPNEYGMFDFADLFERGFNCYTTGDGVRNENRLLAEMQEFAIESTVSPSKSEILQEPWVDPMKPGKLAVLFVMASVAMRKSTVFEDVHEHRLSIHKTVREVFSHHVYAALNSHENSGELQLAAAEAVFGREKQDDLGPPPGRPVTGIKPVEEFESGVFIEIPLAHANRYCLIEDSSGSIKTRVKDNNVYIPFEKIHEPLERHLLDGNSGVAQYLEAAYEETLPDGKADKLVSLSDRLNNHLEKLYEAGNTGMIFKERMYPEKLRCVLKAVSTAPNDVAKLDEYISANEVFDAVTWYREQEPIGEYQNPDDVDHNIKAYEQFTLKSLDSSNGLGKLLSHHSEHDHIEVLEGNINKYKLSYAQGDIKNVNVGEIDDVLELPCLSNVDEFLSDVQPGNVRWVLYSYVRVLLSLENEFGVEDIKEFFSRYPWYVPEKTEYQTRYEKRQTMKDGEPPLPISCNNDNENFTEFCIGKEDCDYSIYSSLPFKKSVYDQLDSGSSFYST